MQLNEWEQAWIAKHGRELDSLLTDSEVAATELLPGTKLTIKKSRYTGLLFGAPAPAWVSIGKNIFYTPRHCFEWRRQHVRKAQRATA